MGHSCKGNNCASIWWGFKVGSYLPLYCTSNDWGEFMVTYITDLKAIFSVHKLIPKNAQMTTLYTNLSLYIIFTMI